MRPSTKRRQPKVTGLQQFRYRPNLEMLEDRLPPGSFVGPMDSFLSNLINSAGSSAALSTGKTTTPNSSSAVFGNGPLVITPSQTSTNSNFQSIIYAPKPDAASSPVTVPTSNGGVDLSGPKDPASQNGAASDFSLPPNSGTFSTKSTAGYNGSTGFVSSAPSGISGSGVSSANELSGLMRTAAGISTGGSQKSSGGIQPQSPAPVPGCGNDTHVTVRVPPGTDINVTANFPGIDYAEMSLAVNPTNPQNIIAYGTNLNDPNGPFVDAYFTMNGGATWTRVQLGNDVNDIPLILADPELPPNSPFIVTNRFDPDVVFDDNGVAYIVYGLEYTTKIPPFPIDPTQTHVLVVVGRSTDGGNTYSLRDIQNNPKSGSDIESNIFNDKYFITAGPARPTGGLQNVFVAWAQLPGSQNTMGVPQIVISGSSGGNAFSAPVVVATGSLQLAQPAIGPNGEVYVVYERPGLIALRESTSFSGGTFNFGPERAVTVLRDTNLGRTVVPAQPDRGIAKLPIIAVDRSLSPNRGTVYVAYEDIGVGSTIPDYDIFLTESGDNGVSWTKPHRVNDDGTTGATQFNVRMTVDQTTGVVGLVWEDTRQDPIDESVFTYAAFSNDAGHTFTPNIQVSNNSSDSAGGNINDFLEYIGIAFFNNVCYFLWPDNSLTGPGGTKSMFFNEITINPGLVSTGSTGGGTNHAKFEPNDSSLRPFNLGTLSTPFFLQGLAITGTDNADWWKFKMNVVNPCYDIQELVDTGSLFMRLYRQNANGSLTQIDSSSNPGNGASQEVHFGVTNVNQVFYLYVFGYNHTQGDYRLLWLS